MVGVSALALSMGLVVGSAAAPSQSVEKTVVNGAGGGGYFVTETVGGGDVTINPNLAGSGADATLFGLKTWDSGSTISNKIFTNYVTSGGNGSGGGAGLGGVFFIDSGSSLTLENVDFNTNSAKGGNGGGTPGLSASAVSVSLATNQTSVIGLGGMVEMPGFDLTGTNGLSVGSITLSTANSLLKPGMKITVPGITGDTPAEIDRVEGKTVYFKQPVTVAPANSNPFAANPIGDPLSANQIRISKDDLGDPMNSPVKVGSYLIVDGKPTDAKVTNIDTQTGVITLSKELTSPPPSSGYGFVPVSTIDATPILSASGTSITMLEKPVGKLEAGMVVSGQGIPEGTKITGISQDGKTITLSQSVDANAKVTGFSAAKIALEVENSKTIINLPSANTKLAKGMVVTGVGIPAGTVIEAISEDGKKVTLSRQLTGNDVPTNLSFSGLAAASNSGSNATVHFVYGSLEKQPGESDAAFMARIKGQVVSGGGLEAGVTVDDIQKVSVGGVDYWRMTLSDTVNVEQLAALRFTALDSYGGSMNGMVSIGSGIAGPNGNDNDVIYPLVNGGEGGDGYLGENGLDAGEMTDQASVPGRTGGAGGNGGNGSSALGFNPDLTLAVALGAINAILQQGQITADLTPKGAPIPTPDPVKAAMDAAELAETYTQLAKDTASLAAWNLALSLGRVGKGGDGGDGGDGGNGTDFFGGGVAGNGGNGGDSGSSEAAGGKGGSGGAGGNGGFGAGGGGGGAGGDSGSGRSAPIGSPGVGGGAGFGGGVGSDGDGLFGGGGSGFGGAVFVRSGGQLTIKGNSNFAYNDVMGGDGGDFGKSGQSAGSDLFMMKGSTVVLNPGAGNTITFNGSIADDSGTSYAGAQYGAGNGASLYVQGPGLVVFNGTNTYSGQTIIQGGTLDADDGKGISTKSNINFNGAAGAGSINDSTAGVLMTNGTFTRQVGTGSTNVQWTGSGGFAATGGDLTVNLGGSSTPQTFTWGKNGFFTYDRGVDGDGKSVVGKEVPGAMLTLGSSYGDSNVFWKNNINLNGAARQIFVFDGKGEGIDDWAYIDGVISGNSSSKLVVGDATATAGTSGTLVLRGKNTYEGGTDVQSGRLATEGTDVLADKGTITVWEGAELWLGAKDTVGDIVNNGSVLLNDDVQLGELTNNGDFEATKGLKIASDIANTGNFTVKNLDAGSNAIVNGVIGDIGQQVVPIFKVDGTLTAGDVTNYGAFEVTGNAGVGEIVNGAAAALEAEVPPGMVFKGTLTAEDVTNYGYLAVTGAATTGAIDNAGTFMAINTLTAEGVVNQSTGLMLLGDDLNATTLDNKGKLGFAGGVVSLDKGFANSGEVLFGGATTIKAETISGNGTITLQSETDVPADLKIALHGNKEAGASIYGGLISGTGGITLLRNADVEGAIADLTLTAQNTYTGVTVIEEDATLRLKDGGSIAQSYGVHVNGGTFDIAGVDDGNEETQDGANIKTLSGSAEGKVALGENTLTITDAKTYALTDENTFDGAFAGEISGNGGLVIASGLQTLSGVNTYEGATTIKTGAILRLNGQGSISNSSVVHVESKAGFDVSAYTGAEFDTTGPMVEIEALTGDALGQVNLGDNGLRITVAKGSFAGDIFGSASSSLIIANGDGADTVAEVQVLEGSNAGFLGATIVEAGTKLVLKGDGSINASSGLSLDGTFDMAEANGNRSLAGLVGGETGAIDLGANRLFLDGASLEADQAARFDGTITGAGGVTLSSGQQIFGGDSDYEGATYLAAGSHLSLAGAGDIGQSSLVALSFESLFDVSNITGTTSSIRSLSAVATEGKVGATVALGGKSLAITDGGDLVDGLPSNWFKGQITSNGTGSVVVSGNQGFVDTTIGTDLVVENGGMVAASGGTITATDRAVLSVIDGGTILLEGTTATSVGVDKNTPSTAEAIYAGFTEADRIANITIGQGAYVGSGSGKLLLVEREGGGKNGIVNLVIDNGGLGTDKTIVGDVLDNPDSIEGMIGDIDAGTYVTVANGSAWSGQANAASFTIAKGASVFFEDGSKINGRLAMEEGAVLNGNTTQGPLQVIGDGVFADGTIHGNLFFKGDFSLGGFLTPGNSPGYVSATGNFTVTGDTELDPGAIGAGDLSGGRTMLEVAFGNSTHAAGVTYDQINIGGNMTGNVLPVQLVGLSADGLGAADRSDTLGDIENIGLLRIGGTVANGSGVTQLNRLTQNGREIRITSNEVASDNRVAAMDAPVIGTSGMLETEFFDSGEDPANGMIVYGLEAFVQDETYALASLTGSLHNAGTVMLGAFGDRVNAQRKDGAWIRVGGAYSEIDDTIDTKQTMGFTQAGIDLISTDMFRVGVLGAYGNATGEVTTDLGLAGLDGTIWSGGMQATVMAGGFYLDATAQYGGSDWTIRPVEASGTTTINGMTTLAAVEAGVSIGTSAASVTPWAQMVYQTTQYSDLQSDWVDGVDFVGSESMLVRGGVRVEGEFGGFVPYANLAVAQDIYDDKAVIVDNYDGVGTSTGMGGMRVEFGGGFSSQIGQAITISTDLSGAQGIGDAGLSSFQGQIGLQGKW